MYKARLQPLHQVWYWSTEGVKRFWADNTLGSKEWFDFNLWTCDLKINRDHLLNGGKPCTKFGIDQVKGSKDIERTKHWARKSGLTLTFEHVTWKSIGIIYSFRATSSPSLLLIKWRGHTDQTTDSCKTICPLFQGRHTNQCCVKQQRLLKTNAYVNIMDIYNVGYILWCKWNNQTFIISCDALCFHSLGHWLWKKNYRTLNTACI